MPSTNTATATVNSGSYTSWHMERAGDNRYSAGDTTTQPAAGERTKTLVTDGRPAGTYFKDNPWHDGGAGVRGPRAHELAKYNDSAYEKQSSNDAPFMKGDRARTSDGTLREVRADEVISNNPTLNERAPEIVAKYGDKTVGELREMTGMSLSAFASLTKAQRTNVLRSGAPVSAQQATINAMQQS